MKKNVFNVIDKINFQNYLEENKDKTYGFKSLVLCVINSVFSISTKFESVENVLQRFVKHAGIKDMNKSEFKVSSFIEKYGKYTADELAENIFRNRQRTSTTNGILKAQAVKEVIEVLYKNEIETTSDMLSMVDEKNLKNQIQKIKGQGSGITFEYLMMLVGDFNRFKPDRQIYNFFEKYLEYGKLNAEQLKDAFFEQLDIVRNEFADFTVRGFDSVIWTFMKYQA